MITFDLLLLLTAEKVSFEKDSGLVDQLLSRNPKLVNKALETLYDLYFRQVRKFVLSNSGTDDDARDMFQEGIMIFYFNLLSGKFEQRSAISTYIFSICKNLWLQRLRKITETQRPDEDGRALQDEQAEVNPVVLSQLLLQLKGDCTRLLTGFYFQGKSIKQLMEEFSLGSEQAAKNKKMRCMEHLIKKIKEKGLGIESFYL